MTTRIEWTDETWNPVTGCTKVSQGCKNCYAERLAPKVFAGQVVEVNTTPPKHPEMKASAFRPRHFTDVLCHPERLDAPLHWKKPRRIFVNSMSDLFHEDVPSGFIGKIFGVMAACQQHTFQVLTKRPERMHDLLDDRIIGPVKGEADQTAYEILTRGRPKSLPALQIGHWPGLHWPLANVWLGVSVEDQATADERIPLLLQTPAAVRFLSCEPLLGPIDLAKAIHLADAFRDRGERTISWVIAGGESGPNGRPSHPDWFRSLRDQCQAVGVAFFMKQITERGRKIDYAAFPPDLQVREYPVLDGCDSEFPG
jgi:protein gp37